MMFKKIFYKLKLFWHSIFYGMSGAEKIIQSTHGNNNEIEVIQKEIGGGGVFADMLEEKQTQQVKETVDAYYRIYKEADKWDTSSITMDIDHETGEIVFRNTDKVKKKTKVDFMKMPEIFNPDNLKVRTIQDNKHFEDKYNDNPAFLYKYETTLRVFRDEFTPRFEIDKIVKKMVVRETTVDGKALVDLYVPSEASQFGKIDAIVISNLHSLKNEKRYKSDLTDFIGFEWYSDKGWNTEDVCLFKYNVKDLIGINIFDGSFVLTYFCDIVEDGKDLSEKFKTKELDEKYSTEAPKREDIDIFTYTRKMERDKNKKNNDLDLDNLGTTTLKIS